jgi:hypothetical protein
LSSEISRFPTTTPSSTEYRCSRIRGAVRKFYVGDLLIVPTGWLVDLVVDTAPEVLDEGTEAGDSRSPTAK